MFTPTPWGRTGSGRSAAEAMEVAAKLDRRVKCAFMANVLTRRRTPVFHIQELECLPPRSQGVHCVAVGRWPDIVELCGRQKP